MLDTPGFIFVACQIGAEAALKAEIARRWPAFRFAYSRPGFLTFKLPAENLLADDFDLHAVFARAYGFSLGHVSGETPAELAAAALQLAGPKPYDRLHVWQRDTLPAGDHGFEPSITPVALEAQAAILSQWSMNISTGQQQPALPPSESETQKGRIEKLLHPTSAGHLVLDCIAIDPGRWWLGYHRASSVVSRWPGGIPVLNPPPEIVSRAYLKVEEAIAWSHVPLLAGDRCVEIGSAPGGASQALLDRGLDVLGIDPADMDERILSRPNFVHVKMRGADVRRREFQGVRWLLGDINVAPAYTLDTVEAIVTHPQVHVQGLILTLKLLQWNLADELPAYLERIRGWGFADVRARQLAFNRQEVCVAALRQRDLRKRARKPAIARL